MVDFIRVDRVISDPQDSFKCPRCLGTGSIREHGLLSTCPSCEGQGAVKYYEVIATVSAPANTKFSFEILG